MAFDLDKDFERLGTRTSEPPEGYTVSNSTCDRDFEDSSRRDSLGDEGTGDAKTHRKGPEATRHLQRKPNVETFDDTPTPPIDVPSTLREHGERRPFHRDMHESYGYDEDASVATTNSSSKRTSLSFDPLVKLDSGDKIPLEEPVPKLSFQVNGRGRSLFEEMSKRRESERDLSRAYSETDREDYDLETGERLDLERRRRDTRYVVNQPRWPFLQTTVDELATTTRGRRGEQLEHQSPSLNSRHTSSPLTDEVQTPASTARGAVISPITIPSPARSEWTSPMSSSSPRRAMGTRSRSYGQERKSSRGSGTRRSNSSSSPASAFLSGYIATEQLPDPDAEGQEVGDYVMGREIGFGGFSIIREAYTVQGDERIKRAVKIVRRQVFGKGELENESLQAEFEHEVSLWRCLHHRRILPLLAVYISDFATFAFMQMNTGGTLFDAVRAHRSGLPGRRARRYSYQIASALRYLHEDMHIVHRDIKLENCLLDTSGPTAHTDGGNVLLCDFGLADYVTGPANPIASTSQPTTPNGVSTNTASASSGENTDGRPRTAPSNSTFEPPQEARQQAKGQQHPGAGNDPRQPQSPHHTFGPSDTSTSLAGSLPYAAPELLEAGRGMIDPCVDVWAYGVTIYSLVTGRLPFQHSFAPRVRVMILSGEWDREKVRSREFGPELVVEGVVGIQRDETGGEDGFEGVSALVEACLERNPKYRPDIRWALENKWLEVERDEEDDEGTRWSS